MPFHVVVKTGATIPDTLNLIVRAVNVYEHSPFIIQLTKQLNPTGNKRDFIKRVFDYVCNNVRYELDNPGNEEVWTPEKTCRERIGDCKKMTVLIATILKCAGIEPVLKHVYYDKELHTHIYVIVPFPDLKNYLTVDPVNHKQWNKEVKHSSASLHFLNGKIMDLHIMGNVPDDRSKFTVNWGDSVEKCVCGVDDDLSELAGMGSMGGEKDQVLAQAMMGDFAILGLDDDEIISGAGIGRRKSKAERKARIKKRVTRLKEDRKKIFHVFKAVNLAPSRASFLLLVRSNIFRLANRLAKAWIHNPDGLTKMWKQFGGDPKKLKATIKAGAWKSISKDIKGIGALGERVPSVMELEAMETKGIGFPPAIAAAIAAATPLVLAAIKIIGKSKHDQDTGEPGNAEILAEAAAKGGAEYAANAGGDEAEETEGIGYMDDADQIVSGEDYDYIDGMGKRRKKDSSARKSKKDAKKAEKKAKKASKKTKHKKSGADGEGSEDGESYQDMSEDEIDNVKSKHKITDADIKTLSTLAEYGTRKILKGQVKPSEINRMEEDETGTKNTPLLPAKATKENDEIAIPGPGTPSNTPTAGSFGLTTINNIPTFLHWLRGAMVLSFALMSISVILSDILIIGSFLWFTRLYIFSFTKKIKLWLTTGKQSQNTQA